MPVGPPRSPARIRSMPALDDHGDGSSRAGPLGPAEGARHDALLIADAANKIRDAEEASDRHRLRRREEVGGQPRLRDGPLQQHDEPIGHAGCFVDVVRDQHDSRTISTFEDLDDRLPDFGAELRIERRKRLVEQEYGRLGGQGSRQRDAVTLAAAEG